MKKQKQKKDITFDEGFGAYVEQSRRGDFDENNHTQEIERRE